MLKKHKLTPKQQLINAAGFKDHFTANQWAEYNQAFFNALAPKYDVLNEIMTFGMQRRYKKKAITRSGIKNGDRVIDIATGSGDMAMLIAKLFPHTDITGVDMAEKMLEIARQRSEKFTNIKYQQADALELPFADQTFDVTVSSYGLRNYSNLIQGIKEMIRVTKPGGKISIIDLGKPEGSFNRWIYQFYFEKAMPFLGKHVFHRGEFNSMQYLPESNKHFPAPARLKQILKACGIKDIQTYSYMNGIVSQQVGHV